MIHTGKKPHECVVHIWEQICGIKQSEATRDDPHTGEKLHECALCGQRFMGVETAHADTYRREAP